MATSYHTTLFTAGIPRGIPATLELRTTGITVTYEGGRFEVPYHALAAKKGGYNNRMLVLSGQDEHGEFSLYLEDRAAVRELRGYRLPPGLATQLAHSGGGGKLKWVLFWAVVVAAVGALLYFGISLGFDAAVDLAVDQIPPDMEAELGKQAAAQQLGDVQVCSAPAVNTAVQAIGTRLTENLGEHSYAFRFRVVDNPDLNAFALPGGYIFVNFGLIEEAAGPHEVAGVLAHEIQHVMRRHGLRNVVGRAGISILAAIIFGDVGGFFAGAAGELAALSFSREQEEEADSLGLDLLYAAHLDPRGLPDFFEKLREKKEEMGVALPSFLSTHPDTGARIVTLRQAIESRGMPALTPLDLDWAAAQAACDPVHISDPDKEVTSNE